MATLQSENLKLQLKDIIQWDTRDVEDMYESFSLNLTINNVSAVHGLKGNYELVSGNIESLISTIQEALEKKKNICEVEFCEPNFRFEIKWNGWRPTLTNGFMADSYEFICWVNSGNWNNIYSETEIGCKFYVEEEQLVEFKQALQQEYDQRQIMAYEDKR